MKKLIAFAFFGSQLFGASIFLDFDTPGTGSGIVGAPLVTALGTITAGNAELTIINSDPEFTTAGASGSNIDIIGDSIVASLSFDFDVSSIMLIYGGNGGSITLNARNGLNAIVDTFFQADTNIGQPAGPITLSGLGIRSLEWFDTGNFAALDNITIADSAVPEPGTFGLLGAGLLGLMLARRKSRAA